MDTPTYLKPDSAAALIGVSSHTLEDWRWQAGLADADIVIHDFRSLAESEGEEQGISETTRATMMGHSAATARKHYTKSRKVALAAAQIAAPIAAALAGESRTAPAPLPAGSQPTPSHAAESKATPQGPG